MMYVSICMFTTLSWRINRNWPDEGARCLRLVFRLQAERVSVAIFLIGLCEIGKGNEKRNDRCS